jgi:lipopolysaccharide/colanic/teichoic acid biosynthesis glycosyltransferase
MYLSNSASLTGMKTQIQRPSNRGVLITLSINLNLSKLAQTQSWRKSMVCQTVETAQTISVQSLRFDARYLQAKRVFDIVFILLIAPFVLLVGLMIALWIKLDSEGPVFFRQTRIGRNGVEFQMLKFRSMCVNGDENIHRKKVEEMMRNGQTLDKAQNDPRITRVGRFIRKTSLDELPQFWNVLMGQMTLVGPRPPLTYEVALYNERDWQRLAGLPGLTGTWQVYGRSVVTFTDMVDMDIAYLKEQSLLKDIKLVFLTVPVMILGKGAA